MQARLTWSRSRYIIPLFAIDGKRDCSVNASKQKEKYMNGWQGYQNIIVWQVGKSIYTG